MKISDYNLDSLKKIKVKGRNFFMFITPRYINHYVENDYEKFTADLILRYTKPKSVFVDVGAHYGFFSILVANNIPKSQVIAIEPVPENFIILNKNIALNQLKNIKTYNYAISNKTGWQKFNITEASDSAGFYNHPLTPTIKKIQVKTITLDKLLSQKKIDIIKIDAEGHELFIMEGMKKILNKNPTCKLIIEFNPKCQKQAGIEPDIFFKKINNFDFDFFLIKENKRKIYKLTTEPESWKNLINEFEYANLLCVPKKKCVSILFFSHSSQLGGSERSLLELVDEFLEKEIMIMVVLPSDGPLKKLLDERPVITEIANYCLWGRGENLPEEIKINENTNSFNSLFDVLPKIKEFNPDVIYTNNISIPWGAITAILLNKPHIWHIREYGKIDHGLNFYLGEKETKKFINFTSNAVICNSSSIKNFYKDLVDEKKMTVAYNYINIHKKILKEKPKEKIFKYKDSTKLLILGTIMPLKGQLDTVLATDILIKKKYKVELVIVGAIGDKEYLKKIKKHIQKRNLEKNIFIKEFIENPYPIIKSADIVLTCSKNEAFGRGTVEAMLLKKAVIGTKSGGTIELIKDGYNGFLYKPGNFQELAEKIEYLIKNKGKIKKLGKNAFNFVKENITKRGYGDKIYKIINMVKKQKPIFEKYYLLTQPFKAALTKDFSSQINNDLIFQNIQLKKELESKTLEISNLKSELEQAKNHIQNLKTQLNIVKSAKFFKLWQFYCKILKKLKLKKD